MIVSLQYLRGVAALMVVWFHCGAQVARFGAPPLPLHAAGEYGVDVFFVISGVVMWVTTVGRAMTPAEFLRRRVERIAPLYWIVTLFLAATALAAPSLLHSTTFNAAHLLASLAFIPWPNPSDGALTPMLVPGWTLNYEMFFYVLFALALLVPRIWRAPVVLLSLVATVAAGIGAPAASLRGFYGDSIVLEFGAGVAIAILFLGRRSFPVWAALAMAAASLPLGWALFEALSRSPGLPRALYAGLPAALAVGGLAFAEKGRRPPFSRFWLHVGDASYSIYLTHPLTLAAVAALWRKAGFAAAAPYYMAGLAATLAVGLASYALIERPIGRWFNRRRTPAHGQAAAHL